MSEVDVTPGAAVKKGQVLAKIDPTDLQLALDQAKAGLASAQAKLDQMNAGPRPENVASAQAQLASAQARLAGMQSGRPENIANAQAAVDSAQAKLDAVMNPFTDADIQAQEAAVAQAQSAVQTAQTNLYNLQHPDPATVQNARIQLESAKNSLNQQYINRDLTCGQKGKDSAECKAANAGAAAASSSVQTAQTNLNNLLAGPKPQDLAQSQAVVQSAQTQLASAQQKLAEMKAGPKPDDVAQAQAALTQAQQQLALQTNPSSPQDIAQQQAAVEQARQQLALQTNPSSPQDIAQQKAALVQVQASVNQAQINLDNAVLTAPFDGIVSTVGYSVGTLSSSGGTVGAPGIALVDTKNLRLDVNADETDVAKVAIGQPTTITFDALSGDTFTGKVTAISPSATVNQGVVTFLVSVVLDPGQSSEMKAGMSGTANIVVAERNNVLLVPNRAVRTVGRNRVVDVLDPSTDKTTTKTVGVGMSNDTQTEITSGLNQGDVVVIPTTTTTAPRVGGGGFGGPGGGPVIIGR
ncbi:MAG: HlyD family efflux transporter periplasmic adaptor subunit [Chloroflexi bacterium]|nr:HlyD family efflux transporter periplasmic adaptor subunit [Chloroflexota bacterium]